MPHEIMGWKSSDGSMHETWSEAAAVEAVGLMMAILPVGLQHRDQIAEQMARSLFLNREKSMVAGIAGLMALMESEPKPKVKLAVDNTQHEPRRSWMKDVLSRAGAQSA